MSETPKTVDEIDINQGAKIGFLGSDGLLAGVVNGVAYNHDGQLYVPVYVAATGKIMIVHFSNIVENIE